jgi:glutathionyl-hydroquinone reductase
MRSLQGPCPGRRDPVLGIERLAEAYQNRFPDYDKGITVPALVDVESVQVVTNDFAQLTIDLSLEWRDHHRTGAPDLYPSDHRDEMLTELPVLWAYARDLFQTPGFGDTIDFAHIKEHYYRVHHAINPTGIMARGPDLSGWSTPHRRDELGGHPFGDGTPPPPPPADEAVPADHSTVAV